MPKRGHVFLTLRDMRIAKIDRKVIAKPCTDEVNKIILLSFFFLVSFLLYLLYSLDSLV